MGLYLGALISGRIFASQIRWANFWEGLYLGGAYDRNFTVLKSYPRPSLVNKSFIGEIPGELCIQLNKNSKQVCT